MAWYLSMGGGIPSSLKTDMNAVLNKKFGTSTTYAPDTWAPNVNLMGPLPEKTASGSIAHITDGADTVPIKSWDVTVDANLDGVSSIEVTQAGKNLYDVDGKEYNVEFYDASGNIVRYADCAVSWIKVNPSTKYSFSYTKETSQTVNVRIAWCKSDKSFISRQGLFSDNQFPMTLTTPNNCEWVQLSVNQYATALIAQNNWSIQVEQGDTSTTFEAYTATNATVSLGRTIYGGSADVVNGTGTDGFIKYELDDNDSWSPYSGAGHSFWHNVATGEDRPIDQTKLSKCICNHLTYSSSAPASAPDFSFVVQGGQRIVVTADSTIDTVDKFKTWLQSNPLVFACPASSPTDFTFTPMSPTPETALGVNNFWADTGDSEVTYRADISLVISALNGNRGLMMMRPVNTEEIEFEEEANNDESNR